ncbi:hypothetical protein [Alysiella crassa]|uniref:Lipoprotein n=1 Tax=Alysiella crassa TaxID=153491 RepID=A0A376BWN4_9NEIS|nr:hypothetical protein [Alysiella crassa]UOP06281.1 hypothetical protein LVJ80_10770 [Alysiella crassa]SSY80774.1 Uncharacterised protein [Alysiella crassa]
MKLNQLAVLTSVSLLLAACASGSYQWHKNGVSVHDTNNQISKCKYDIDMARDVSAEKAKAMLTNCMQKEGYRWVYR